MGLNAALRRFAADVPHVLVAQSPAGTAARLAVENVLRVRGWPEAASPADADLLVVTGPEDPGLAEFFDQAWGQVPGPRARVHVPGADDAVGALDEGKSALAAAEPAAQHDSHSRPSRGGSDHQHDPSAGHGGDAGAHHDPGSDHQHGHGSGEDLPGGLAMAERGDDRDGLTLDQLHVPLGPVLPAWPAGLVLRTTVQGDVLQDVRVAGHRRAGPADAFWTAPWHRADTGHAVTIGEATRRRAGAHLDSLARVLTVVGWPDAACRARRVRDAVLASAPAAQVASAWFKLAGRLRRSRTLRWLTDGLGVLSSEEAAQAGVTGPALRASRASGDVSARWAIWLDELDELLPHVDDVGRLTDDVEPPRGQGGSAPLLAVLPDLLEGTEFATARLIVASFDPDLAELTSEELAAGFLDG